MQKKASLERIHDNQRRSRAQRKEHLQGLEARVRNYELQSIRASSEMQEAARRVAEENKKLRSLLANLGITDDTVVAFSQSALSSYSLTGPQIPNTTDTIQPAEERLPTYRATLPHGNISIPDVSRLCQSENLDSWRYIDDSNIGFHTQTNLLDREAFWHFDTIQTAIAQPMAKDWMSYAITHGGLTGNDQN